jgi:hypothetical protein
VIPQPVQEPSAYCCAGSIISRISRQNHEEEFPWMECEPLFLESDDMPVFV